MDIGINRAGFLITALGNDVDMLASRSHRRVCLRTPGIGNSVVLPIYVARSVKFEKRLCVCSPAALVLKLVSGLSKGPGTGRAVAYH
jgi:hypothetical protein